MHVHEFVVQKLINLHATFHQAVVSTHWVLRPALLCFRIGLGLGCFCLEAGGGNGTQAGSGTVHG